MEIVERGKYLYSFEFKNPSAKTETLIKSLFQSRLLGSGTTTTSDFSKINFNAIEVIKLSDLLNKYQKERNIAKLNYDETENLIISLQKQLVYLKKCGYTFFNFTLENTIVVTKNKDKIFIFMTPDYLLNIEKKKITFCNPFNLNERFLDPELKKIITLPAKAHYKSIYYSLGSLALHCLFSDSDSDEANHERKLEQIKFTKVYWEILRCFDKEPDKRIVFNL
jgi:hypothetical protein